MLGNVSAERRLLEQTYDGLMTVTGSRKRVEDGETVIDHDAVLCEGEPCALSLAATPATDQDGTAGAIRYDAVLFCAPELDLPPGCHISVSQYGKTIPLLYSGERALLPTHQQLSVRREGWA